jgi:hypothetical protein
MSVTADFTFRVADWLTIGGGLVTAGGLVAVVRSGLATHSREIIELKAEGRDREVRLRALEQGLPRVEERISQVQGSISRIEGAVMELLKRGSHL